MLGAALPPRNAGIVPAGSRLDRGHAFAGGQDDVEDRVVEPAPAFAAAQRRVEVLLFLGRQRHREGEDQDQQQACPRRIEGDRHARDIHAASRDEGADEIVVFVAEVLEEVFAVHADEAVVVIAGEGVGGDAEFFRARVDLCRKGRIDAPVIVVVVKQEEEAAVEDAGGENVSSIRRGEQPFA